MSDPAEATAEAFDVESHASAVNPEAGIFAVREADGEVEVEADVDSPALVFDEEAPEDGLGVNGSFESFDFSCETGRGARGRSRVQRPCTRMRLQRGPLAMYLQ